MKRAGLAGLVAFCTIPVLVWLTTSAIPAGDRFGERTITLRTLALVCALTGFSGWAANIIQGARIAPIERAWDGLDHLYRAHRRTGEAVVLLLVLHGALMLASMESLVALGPESGAIFFGPIVLAVLVVLVVISIYGRLHHDPFVWIQRAIGGLFFLAGFHVFGIQGEKAVSRPLQVVLILYTGLALAAFVYRSVLGRTAAPRHHYTVAAMHRITDRITEVVLDPVDHPIRFLPGQFAFLSLGAPAHDTRAHPFSITSHVDDPQLRFVVKGLGDHTRELATIPAGTSARVEGPYGSLSHTRIANKRQVWIGGGIGITPFLSMARAVAKGGGYDVDLYYCTADAAEAHFHDELAEHVTVIPVREDTDGLITAERIASTSGPLGDDTDYLLCGPPPMLRSLRTQLEAAGVPPQRVHAEDFSFRR
jgi:predicted ferric reductase